jgi:hypothetical protein
MDRLSGEKVDIFLGNHMQHNDTKGKAKLVSEGKKDAFVNPDEWKAYCLWAKENMYNMINGERK